MTNINSQVGVKTEVTFGTPPVQDRFHRATDFKYKAKVATITSKAQSATGLVQRADLTRSHKLGADVSVQYELMTKGFGWWNPHIFGVNATTGPTDSAYTHSGTLGLKKGISFGLQGNSPFTPSGTNQPMTFGGCKVKKAEYTFQKGPDGMVLLDLDIDAQNCDDGATSLASASYAAGAMPYDWVDIAVSIGGSSVPVDSCKLTIENPMKLGDYKQQASALQNEPADNDFIKVMFEVELDFSSLTQWNRIRTAVAATRFAAVVITATCTDTGATIGAATQPSATFTLPKWRPNDPPEIDTKLPGSDITQKLSGECLWDGSTSPVTLAYVSADTTA